MSRPLRVEFPGAWYHVMNRGSHRQTIFFNHTQRKMFLGLLSDIKKDFDVEIHAYCLMPNHYHLLLKTNHANLSQVMRNLNGIYTQRVNKSMKSDGPLFRGRYKASLVGSIKYLIYLSRYIHLNPVKAGITKLPEDYNWSSAQIYLFKKDKPVWLSTTRLLRNKSP